IAYAINKDIIKASLSNNSGADSNKKLTITLSPRDMKYSGKEVFNIMEGVMALDIDGKTDITDQVNVIIVTDTSIGKKIIRYSVVGSNGNLATNERRLNLINYTGPSIHVSNDVVITSEDLDDLVNILIERDAIRADDGFGNDITRTISYNYEAFADSHKCKFTFTVQNVFNDVASKSIFVEVEGSSAGPTLIIARKTVALKKGDVFNPYEYIKSAYDKKDGDLTEFVVLSGKVDTNKEGQYTVTYTLSNLEGVSVTQRLVVYVG
ncbi:MAG: DUF5011 domain-containing protein, partial [Clostridiaceae bacterium]|nr:DUF5011 domain-containing protein [Clostridiaceae bacterium]